MSESDKGSVANEAGAGSRASFIRWTTTVEEGDGEKNTGEKYFQGGFGHVYQVNLHRAEDWVT